MSEAAAIAHPPIIFDEFFEKGLTDEVSPFLTPQSRRWGAGIHLKAAIFSAFLLVIAFVLQVFLDAQPIANLLLVGVYFFAGLPALIDALEDLSHLETNIDVLMTLAAFLSVLIGSALEGGLLLVLFAISGAMEEAVSEKAKGAVSSLYKLSPTKAWLVLEDGSIGERSVKDLKIGATILVKAGEVVPLDGKVIKGTSSVNLVHLTGENLPALKKEGDTVPAGARNHEGALTLVVTHTSTDSTLARIIQLVTQAQEARPRLQRWFDQMSDRYATIVILLTILFAVSLPFVLNVPFLGVEGSIYRSIAFLIAASPCALLIATPIAYLSALSVCARKGILLKGGVILDALSTCTAIAFDKTGTLTTGELKCKELTALQSTSPLHQAIQVAATLEQNAVHPIAKALLQYAVEKKATILSASDFKVVPGYGVEANVTLPEKVVQTYLGSADYILPKLSPELAAKLTQEVERVRLLGDVLAVLLYDQQLFLFQLEDRLRPDLHKAIQHLKQQGSWRLLMLTGDHIQSATKIASQLGLDEFYADLKPEDKLRHVSELSKERGLAMVGDGMNDAPALARATVGICMGKVGSATAVEAADAILLNDNIELMGWLMKKAHQTRTIVKQNLFLAASVILLATTPALLGWVPLWLAVILHEGGTVLVGLNALRLLKQ